jgi:hypothetical protein
MRIWALSGVAEALLVAPDGLIRQFGLVPAPDEHPPGLVALAVAVEREWEAAVQQLDGRDQLILATVAGQRLFDELARDPTPLEIPGNPLVPPAIEQAPILSEPARIAGIVKEPLVTQGPDYIGDDVALESASPQEGIDFALAAFADADRLQRPLHRPLSIVVHSRSSSERRCEPAI